MTRYSVPDLAHLRRPALLMRGRTRRAWSPILANAHLKRRHLGDLHHPASEAVLETLLEIENELNQMRRIGSAGYSSARHVDVVIAILGEVRLMHAAARQRSGEGVGHRGLFLGHEGVERLRDGRVDAPAAGSSSKASASP